MCQSLWNLKVKLGKANQKIFKGTNDAKHHYLIENASQL